MARKAMCDTAGDRFGSVSLDGFDVDVETNNTLYYDAFARQLQTLFASATKPFYISAAPSCANGSVTPVTGMYQYTNFVWTRNYNAAACSMGTPGFLNSMTSWTTFLNSIVGSCTFPRYYIGGITFDSSQTSGANTGSGVGSANLTGWDRALGDAWAAVGSAPRWGGAMLWDGTIAVQNQSVMNGVGVNWLNYTKLTLTNQTMASGSSSWPSSS